MMMAIRDSDLHAVTNAKPTMRLLGVSLAALSADFCTTSVW